MDRRHKAQGEGALKRIETDADRLFPDDRRMGPAASPDHDLSRPRFETLHEALVRVGRDITLPGEPDDTPALLEIGLELRRERSRQGLSQTVLAKRVGITQAMLSNIEAGKGSEGPTWTTMRKLASALDLRLTLRPDDASARAAPLGEVPILKPSKAADARVRVTTLGDDGASFVRGYVSKAELKWVSERVASHHRTYFVESGAEPTPSACVWSLAPHVGTRITARKPVILVTQGHGCIRTREVDRGDVLHLKKGGEVVFVYGGGGVVLANTGASESMAFSVPADEFVLRRAGGL